MGIINQLDMSVANLIAAGEVVERPASVIKELLENSIDAGATDITVEIKNGGVTFMRVSDNGNGMSRDDAQLCLSRHATSKIRSAEDLDGIMTLGFRGEALAAISSVSKLRIMTRKKSQSEGTIVESEYGKILSVADSGCRAGTTMIVEELFSNTPARRKFLKSDRAEAMAIAAVIEKIAISSPKVSIKYIQDNVQKMMTSGNGKLYDTLYSIFGREFAAKLIAVDSMSDGITVRGYIGRPDNVRANRNFENFFINSRYVKSKTAGAALEQAFSSYLESDKFPTCVLFIDIHPAFVDVNVHPTKLEIKFSNERAVFDAVYIAVKNAVCNDKSRNDMYFEREDIPDDATKTLNTFTPVYDRLDPPPSPEQLKIDDILPPKIEFVSEKAIDRTPFDDVSVVSGESSIGDIGQTASRTQEITKAGDRDKNIVSFLSECRSITDFEEKESGVTAQVDSSGAYGRYSGSIGGIPDNSKPKSYEFPTEQHNTEAVAVTDGLKSAEVGRQENQNKIYYKYLGIVFNTYIIIEYENKMLMIDKHAAHERILFEKMRKYRDGEDKYSQILLVPMRLSFTREEIACAESFADEIRSVGFDYEIDYPASCISLTVIPGGIEESIAFGLFSEVVSGIGEGKGTPGVSRAIFFEKSLYQASCKAALKGGNDDGEEHMRYIVESLLGDPKIRYCPHGRPVMFEMTQSTIEHRFKRT